MTRNELIHAITTLTTATTAKEIRSALLTAGVKGFSRASAEAVREKRDEMVTYFENQVGEEPEPQPEPEPEPETVEEPEVETEPTPVDNLRAATTKAARTAALKALGVSVPSKANAADVEALAVSTLEGLDANAKVRANAVKRHLKARHHYNDWKPLTDKTIAKLAATIADATPEADGVIILTGEDFALHGLGRTWTSDFRGGRIVALREMGYTATPTRGVLVVVPLTDEEVEQAG